MKILQMLQFDLLFFCLVCCAAVSLAENVDPYGSGRQYGYSENTGWLNAAPSTGNGMQIASDKVTGWVWGENIGWINLHCENNGNCGEVSFGVVNDGAGNLSGYAWGENVGWINFNPTSGGVTIDADGYLDGWAWGENIGWIRFDAVKGWSVQVCIVTLEDLQNFASQWLQPGVLPGNLDGIAPVDMADYSLFAQWWQDFCPDGWQLK